MVVWELLWLLFTFEMAASGIFSYGLAPVAFKLSSLAAHLHCTPSPVPNLGAPASTLGPELTQQPAGTRYTCLQRYFEAQWQFRHMQVNIQYGD